MLKKSTVIIYEEKPMPLTTCKECNKEISTEAVTCPYCGIANPGVIDNNNRRVGVVVLALLVFLCVYTFTRYGRVDYQYPESARISDNKKTDVAKVVQDANPTQTPLEQPKLIEAPANEASTPSQQALVTTMPRPSVIQDLPKQNEPVLDKTKNISSADTPQAMVMRMLEYALKDGGLSHESEIQQTKLKIESSPFPAKGNKKAAKAINAKGLASSKNGDFNNAVKLFEEASKLDKSDIEIVNNLGFSYLKQGNLDSAQQAITIALTLSPGRATAWENLGEVFGIKGDLNKAVACFSNAYRFSKDRLKMHQYMKKLNEKENIKNLIQARAKAINWAENSYLINSKK
jgi:tetratricopeptide (TPR) repeat protein